MAETVRQELHRLRLIARHIGKLSPASREWLRDALNDERVQWGEDTNVLPPNAASAGHANDAGGHADPSPFAASEGSES